jgi:Fe-S cluster assembly ATPase SufC
MPVLAISDLKVDIHGNTVLHDIDLTLERGRAFSASSANPAPASR